MNKKIWNHLKKGRGFTLLEIVIAILILTVALLGLASLTSMIIKGNASNKTLTIATTLAKDKLEELRSKAYTDIPAGPVTDTRAANGISAGSFYTRTWRSTAGAQSKTITATVTWAQGRTVELKTIRAKE